MIPYIILATIYAVAMLDNDLSWYCDQVSGVRWFISIVCFVFGAGMFLGERL